jgi:hypothetical protein
MNDADRLLVALAARQRQVFTRRQARLAGLTAAAIHRRVRTGVFVVHGPHTLHFAGSQLDWRGMLLAGLYDLGDEAAVTGRAAAALHGLDGFEEGPIELLVPRRIRGRAPVGQVSSGPRISRLDIVTVEGDLRVTSGTRTIVELAGRVTERELANAVDSACRMGLTAPDALRRRWEQLGRQGRPGVAAFERVMEMAGVQSWLERRFLDLVARYGLPRPSLQRVYGRDGQHVARVDFDLAPSDVSAEVGGRRGYMSADERRRQERRRDQLQLMGKVVYFFTTDYVVDAAGYVASTIAAALRKAA